MKRFDFDDDIVMESPYGEFVLWTDHQEALRMQREGDSAFIRMKNQTIAELEEQIKDLKAELDDITYKYNKLVDAF